MEQASQIPLSEAAQQLRISWQRAWRLVLTGDLSGRKVNGRWMVTKASVAQQMNIASTTPSIRPPADADHG
jgi:hypothetical protein